MNFQKFFPSKYLNAVDLDGQGDVTVVIRSLDEEQIQGSDGTTENKPVLRLQGTQKGLILNRTNAETISQLYGNDIENWVGKRIALHVEKDVHAFGKKWDVVRIRGQVPPNAIEAGATVAPDDGLPSKTVAEEGALPF
jgi:hypothetical protein